MAINIETRKNQNENSASVMRRFTQRVRGSGISQRMRKIRYRSRPLSQYARKMIKLRKLERSAQFETLIKEGKISDGVRGKRVKNLF